MLDRYWGEKKIYIDKRKSLKTIKKNTHKKSCEIETERMMTIHRSNQEKTQLKTKKKTNKTCAFVATAFFLIPKDNKFN